MKVKLLVLSLMFIFVSSAVIAADNVTKSTASEQVSIEVTVYNNNLGLVKDTRKVALPAGDGELQFMDVAALIKPETVHVKSLNNADAFTVFEQNYEYDLMNESKLLDKYVGKKVKIIEWNEYKDKKESLEAELLSNNQGQIYRINNEIYLGYPGIKVLPELPENLIAKPTLMWNYGNKAQKPHNLEISYLTNGINWKADYVLVLNKDDSNADLSGWVTLDNKSGATYKDASLKLVAGTVHRAEERYDESYEVKRVYKGMAAEAPQFEEKAFFEYHIYDLQRKTTIKDNQAKQISLLEADGVKTDKELLVYGNKSYFTRQYREQNPKQPVNIYIKFKNSKKNNLGMPLPAGIMRLYKEDDKGSLQFAGEDRIEHTPKDEEVRLKIGEAFDVTAERIQTDYKLITSSMTAKVTAHESEWEITIRNHKDTDVTVGIIEPLYGSWNVIKNSHSYKKVDAFTLRFDVKVPKDKEVKVRYRVRVEL